MRGLIERPESDLHFFMTSSPHWRSLISLGCLPNALLVDSACVTTCLIGLFLVFLVEFVAAVTKRAMTLLTRHAEVLILRVGKVLRIVKVVNFMAGEVSASATATILEDLIVWSINDHLIVTAFNHGSVRINANFNIILVGTNNSLASVTPRRLVQLIISTVGFARSCRELPLVAHHGPPPGQPGPLVPVFVVFAHCIAILDAIGRREAAADEGDDESDDGHHDQQND